MQTKTTHSQGPWHLVESADQERGWYIEPQGTDGCVGRIFGRDKQSHLNAVLVAQAPNLLSVAIYAMEELNRIKAELGRIPGAVQQTVKTHKVSELLRVQIALAEGL